MARLEAQLSVDLIITGAPVVPVAVVVDAGEGLELSAQVVVQMRRIEGERTPARVHDVEHGAGLAAGLGIAAAQPQF